MTKLARNEMASVILGAAGGMFLYVATIAALAYPLVQATSRLA